MKHVIGRCPHCGGEVVEFSKFYGCRNWRPIDGACPFTMPKVFAGREIPPYIASELIKNRSTSERLDGFISPSTGRRFSARLELQSNGKRWRLKMRFKE